MSWSSKRFYGFIVGALVVGSMVVGCGGDASIGPDPGVPSIPASGGITQNAGTSNETRAATAGPQQVQVTVNGNIVTGFIPGGMAVAAGQQVVGIGPGNALITGLSARSRTPGDIEVRQNGQGNFFPTGVHLNSDGSLSGFIFLIAGNWEARIVGPLAIRGNGLNLDLETFILQAEVRDGQISLPIAISGQLPVNGGSTHTLRLNIQLSSRFHTGEESLRITHANGILGPQVRNLVNGHCEFSDLSLSGSSSIPPQGVQTVELRYFLLTGG